MLDGLEKTGTLGVVGLAVAAALHQLGKLAIKIADRWRTPQQIKREEMELSHEQTDYLNEQLEKALNDLRVVRERLRSKETEAHQYETLVYNFLIDFPHHTDWWRKRLPVIQK